MRRKAKKTRRCWFVENLVASIVTANGLIVAGRALLYQNYTILFPVFLLSLLDSIRSCAEAQSRSWVSTVVTTLVPSESCHQSVDNLLVWMEWLKHIPASWSQQPSVIYGDSHGICRDPSAWISRLTKLPCSNMVGCCACFGRRFDAESTLRQADRKPVRRPPSAYKSKTGEV